jgi:hypothetical protein
VWHNPLLCDDSCCPPCVLPTISQTSLGRSFFPVYNDNWTVYWTTKGAEITFLYVNEVLVYTRVIDLSTEDTLIGTNSSYASSGPPPVIRIVAANSCGPVVFECTYYELPQIQYGCNYLVASPGDIVDKADEEYEPAPVVEVTVTGLCSTMSAHNGTYYVPCVVSEVSTDPVWQTFVDVEYTESGVDRPFIRLTIEASYTAGLSGGFVFRIVSSHRGGVGLTTPILAEKLLIGGFTNRSRYAIVRSSGCAPCENIPLESRSTSVVSTIGDCFSRQIMPTDWDETQSGSAASGLTGICNASNAILSTELVYA